MAKVKISSNYRIVIPKDIRKKLGARPGDYLEIRDTPAGILLSRELKWPNDYIALHRELWRNVDVEKYIEEERNSWD